MAIPKVNPRTVLLLGKETAVMKEAPAAAAITPGHLVELDANSKWKVHATASGVAARAFAVEADLIGKGIDDNYAANDVVYTWIVQSGAEVNALVAAAATAITAGDKLESAGDGTLRKATAFSQSGTTPFAVTPAGNVVAIALKSVDNSGGGSPARIPVMIV